MSWIDANSQWSHACILARAHCSNSLPIITRALTTQYTDFRLSTYWPSVCPSVWSRFRQQTDGWVSWQSYWLTRWLTLCLSDRSADLRTNWLNYWLTYWLTVRPNDSPAHHQLALFWLTIYRTDNPTEKQTYWPIDSPTDRPTRLYPRPSFNPLTDTLLLDWSLDRQTERPTDRLTKRPTNR